MTLDLSCISLVGKKRKYGCFSASKILFIHSHNLSYNYNVIFDKMQLKHPSLFNILYFLHSPLYVIFILYLRWIYSFHSMVKRSLNLFNLSTLELLLTLLSLSEGIPLLILLLLQWTVLSSLLYFSSCEYSLYDLSCHTGSATSLSNFTTVYSYEFHW